MKSLYITIGLINEKGKEKEIYNLIIDDNGVGVQDLGIDELTSKQRKLINKFFEGVIKPDLKYN